MDPQLLLDTWTKALESGNPVAIVALVYLTERAFFWARGLRQKANGGTSTEKVLKKLDQLLDVERQTLEAAKATHTDADKDHEAARVAMISIAQAIQTLSAAVDRNTATNEVLMKVLHERVR